MRIACSTSAFRETLEDALSRIGGMGFGYVDLLCNPSWPFTQPQELAEDAAGTAERVGDLLEGKGLRPAALNVAFGRQPYEREPELNAARLRQARGIARFASALGVELASFYPGYRADEEAWEETFASWLVTWRELTPIAAERGVEFLVELHAQTPLETLAQCGRLLEELPEQRIAYDPSHFAMQGIALPQTEWLLGRAAHVHVRDAAPGRMYVPLGEGAVDFDWLFGALRERGYEGFVSVECLGDGAPEVLEDVARLKAMVEDHLGE